MSDRKAKLEKALARRYIPSHEVMNAEFVGGLNYHADRLAPLHAALVSAVENLEDIRVWCRDRTATDGTIYAIGLSRSTEALAKIDEAINQQTKNSNS